MAKLESKRAGARTLTLTGTATGYSTDWIALNGGYQQFGVYSYSTGSTKCTTGSFRVMGGVGPSSGGWVALMAADNPTTGGIGGAALVNTTAGLTVDRVILTSTSMSATSTEAGYTLTVTVVPLVGG